MNSKIYTTFLQRMKETDEVKELQSSNVKVIQAALTIDSNMHFH